MPLPVKARRYPRPRAVTVRMSDAAYNALLKLQQLTNLTQADIFEQLIFDEHARIIKEQEKNK